MPHARLLAAALALLPAASFANCYSIYTGANQLVYQSTLSPVDLSKRISDAMAARFPGDFMVMNPDETACTELRVGARPRFDQVGSVSSSAASADQVLQASPVVRNNSFAATPQGATPGARSGPTLAPGTSAAARGGRR